MIDNDDEALESAIALTIAEDPTRAEQVQSMLQSRSRWDVGTFCSYHRQSRALNLNPWERPPCWTDPDQVDAIIESGPDHREYGAAKLLKKMLALGLSAYDPEPLAAIERANLMKV